MGRNLDYGEDIHPLIITLDALRIRNGMSIEELCKKAYISLSTYYKWLEGRTSPKLEHISAVADLFGCEIHIRRKAKEHATEKR